LARDKIGVKLVVLRYLPKVVATVTTYTVYGVSDHNHRGENFGLSFVSSFPSSACLLSPEIFLLTPHFSNESTIMQGEHWDVTHSEEQSGNRPPGMQQQPFIGFGIDQNWGGFGQMMPPG
jgi:hypothetical protein